ncbi:hypothetical protein HMPREF0322_05022 [Desulfitobacterium hafniense DP7]|uniref:Uncharacterized protein n=1 Tax=Desulfitobacterium hafniense DP7 TaxID=537010 RepID=G9XVK9_DESHA|nr:hypothetical protein HMPREF0322_05022 [Desulfitobacterium hafniense DP7]
MQKFPKYLLDGCIAWTRINLKNLCSLFFQKGIIFRQRGVISFLYRKLCTILKCNISDILEIISDEQRNKV